MNSKKAYIYSLNKSNKVFLLLQKCNMENKYYRI